tara:strand:+ start:13348 stop:14520 length:1173 start_codon:yes stop_codon:yes gene_type:complete
MKFSQSTRLASLVLAIGFFFACSSSKPSIDTLVDSKQYDIALAQIEEQLQNNPNQPGLLVQKGEINILIASTLEPIERSQFYAETASAFDQAISIGADSLQQEKISLITGKIWTQEHNAGTAAYNNENLASETQAHFNNAIIINPKESNSYISLATAQFSSGEIDDAILTLNKAKNSVDEVPPKVYENLGFLYLQNGDPDQSVFYYELANKDLIQSKNIAFGLVNAYISTSNTEAAVQLLNDLVESYPNDATIRNVYGTQLYIVTETIMDDLVDAYLDSDTALVSQIRFEAEGVGEQAEEELIQAYSRDTTNTEFIESLAVFYNNLTGKYFSVLEVAFENDKASLTAKTETLLNLAIQYYENLSEKSSDNSDLKSTIEALNMLKKSRFSL